jgi:DUF1680 family protein
MLTVGRYDNQMPVRHTLASPRSIKVDGQLDRRLRHALDRVASDRIFDERFVLQDVARVSNYHRQFEEWAGDLSGRYIGAVAAGAAYAGDEYPLLHEIARRIPVFQRPTGLVGSDQSLDVVDFSVIWGQGRLLAGLLDYHAVYPSDGVFACARRLGDYYVRAAPTWARNDVRAQRDFPYYTQGIGGLVALYRSAGAEAYLAISQSMAMLWLEANADRGLDGRHSHAVLSTLLGLLDVYECTGQHRFLEAVQESARAIARGMSFVDGAPPEFFPWSERNEGCSMADWLHLNLRLGHVTGQAEYFDAAEGVWRNALYANQAANGGFCHRHFSAERHGYSGAGCEAWWCCSLHGLRVYAHLLRYLYSTADNEVRVNLLEPGTVELDGVRIALETVYPTRGETTLRVLDAPDAGVNVLLRIPPWASGWRVVLNDAVTSHTVEAGYLNLSSTGRLRSGDVVTVTFPMGLRVQSSDDERGSLWWGPLLLACEIPGGSPCAVALPAPDSSGVLRLPSLDAPDHPYAIPGSHFSVVATGNPVALPIDSLNMNQPQTGRLRPLAEQSMFRSPPPATVNSQIVYAHGGRLEAELAHLLGSAVAE